MPVTSYEVGAIFAIEDRATSVLERMAGLFETLAERANILSERLATLGEGAFSGLVAGADRAESAINRGIEQANALAASWGNAAKAAARYSEASGAGGAGGGGGGRRRGGGGGEDDLEAAARRQMVEDRRNADWMNSNENQIYDRQYRDAIREKNDRDRLANEGPIGPPDRPGYGYREYDEAQTMNRDFDRRADIAAENERVRMARPDANMSEVESTAKAGAAGYLGGHAGGVAKGMGPIAALAAGYEAFKHSFEEEQAVAQSLTFLGISRTQDPEAYAAASARLEAINVRATQGTQYSTVDSARAMPDILPILGKRGPEAIKMAEEFYPVLLRLGELSSQMGRGSVASEGAAGAEFAHLMQNFNDVNAFTHSLDIVNAAARGTGTSIAAQESIAKYPIGIGMGAGLTGDQVMADVYAAELSLGSTSAAGTGAARFYLASETFHGASGHGMSKKHQDEAKAERRHLEHALSLSDDPLAAGAAVDMKKDALKAHDRALVKLGLYTEAGKPLAQNAEGGLDEALVKQRIFDYGQSHDKQETQKTLVDAYGMYALKWVERYLPKGYIEQERSLEKGVLNPPTVLQEQKDMSGTTMQQFMQVIANITNTGTILANTTLPGFNSILVSVNEGLIKFNTWLRDPANQRTAEVAGYGAAGAAALAALGLVGAAGKFLWSNGGAPIVKGIKSIFGGGGEPLSMAEAPPGEAATVAGSGGGFWGGLGRILQGAPMLAYQQYLMRLQADPKNIDPATGDFDIRRAFPIPGAAKRPSGTDAEHHAGTAPAAAAPTTVNLTITNTMNGVADESTFQSMLHKFTDAVKTAISHATGDPQGSTHSPYVSGGL